MNALKPNTLVYANLRDTLGYNFIGEVMSLPIPANCSVHAIVDPSCHDCAMNYREHETIMVRRVPGHPGTLTELPTECLTVLEDPAKYRWVHYGVVNGRGQFPVDMLRYDNAAPVNFEIVPDNYHGAIATKPDPASGIDGFLIATVSEHRDHTRPGVWTPERWSSFLWGFKPLKTLPLAETSEATLKQIASLIMSVPPSVYGVRALDRLYGPDRKNIRRAVMEGLTGTKPKAADCGIGKVSAALYEAFGITDYTCIADREAKLDAAVRAVLTEKLFATFETCEFALTKEQALSASHQGDCDADVKALLGVPEIATQLDAIGPDAIRRALKPYGAWNEIDLADNQQNRARFVWCAACNIVEENP